MMRRENAAMFRTGYIVVECRVVRPDGSVRWVWIRGFPVLEHGRVVRVVGAIEDVTEKRLMAAEREAGMARLQLHIARMPLAYVLFDADLRGADWNPAAERILGYARAEALGMKSLDFVPPSFRSPAEDIMRRMAGGDMGAHSVNENVTKDGRTITCRWHNTPLRTRATTSVARTHGFAVSFLRVAVDIARSHHERFDGTGYLDRLTGDAIPLAARNLAVADVYDALRSERAYKPAWSHAEAVRVMVEEDAGHFDPALLAVFRQCPPSSSGCSKRWRSRVRPGPRARESIQGARPQSDYRSRVNVTTAGWSDRPARNGPRKRLSSRARRT